MNLHRDKEVFASVVSYTASSLGIPREIIEKDYYVTMALKSLATHTSGLVFKGGTSLSKCYHLIDRFSEDIDLSFASEKEKIGDGKKKRFKQDIVKSIAAIELEIHNLEETRSRRNFNRYTATYPSLFQTKEYLKKELIIETYIAIRPFPTEKKMADSYIYRVLKQERMDIIEKYEMMPFEITTQAVERTLADKMFALCDYYIEGDIKGHSRHIYDIYKIIEANGITGDMREFVAEVRTCRAEIDVCHSAKPGVDIAKVLMDILKTEAYKSDYNNITKRLLFVPVEYEVAIEGIKQLIDSGICYN